MTPLIDRISKTYDEVPYTSAAFPVSAPEHLRAVAHLFGLDTPLPERARVLELGCAAGGNLIPFAVRHPDAEVVGVDLSPVQIDIGRGLVEAMGLANVRLIQGSIAELGDELGRFDYIVCHGVYSWVPEEVRVAILDVCDRLLTDNGVAYVSYNTYPGWKAKEIVRDAMLLRAGDRATAQERLAYARGMIEFLHEQAAEGSVLGTVMKEHIDMIREGEDFYLSHEYLELCNAPCYFRDFVAAARDSGLEYLGDATVASMFASNYGAAAAPALLAECGGDQVMLEQLMDFLQNRTFRQSLLVRAGRRGEIQYQVDPERIARLHLAGRYVPETGADGAPQWRYAGGATVSVGTDATRVVLERLNAAWPATVSAVELMADASVEDASRVSDLITNLVIGNAVRFRVEPVVAGTMSASPFAHAAVRALAAAGENPMSLFNQWHQPIQLTPLQRYLLPLLDGATQPEALVEVVLREVEQGRLHVMREGQPLTNGDAVAASVREQVNASLNLLMLNAMLATPPAQPAKKAAATAKQGDKCVEKAAATKPAKAANAKAEAKPEASPKPAKAPRGKK